VKYSLTLNPIIAREFRSRWRDRRSFLVVFCFVSALAGITGMFYASAANSAYPQSLVQIGSQIFGLLAWVGTLGWLLISPALTASSIAYERERGLLEHLLMAPISAGAIVRGKLAAGLCFGLILLTASLPLLAMTLLFGRVSPAEFGIVAALQAGSGIFGAIVGLTCSAFSYRGNMAMRSAYGLLVVWIITSFVGSIMTGLLPPRLFAPWLGTSGSQILQLYGKTNPIAACLEVISVLPGAFDPPAWQVSLGFEAIAGLGCLLLATRLMKRPLPDQQWITPKKSKGNKPHASHVHIPLVGHLRFANPMLDREVRSKFRMRQPPAAVIVAEVILGLIVGYYYLRTLYGAWFDVQQRTTIWWVICGVGIIVVMLATPVMGANAFARERENGTWEGIQLSLLSARDIVMGKLGGSLIACFLFSIPVWPLLLPCIRWRLEPFETYWNDHGVRLPVALAVLLVFASTAFAYTAFGMWISWRIRRTSAAVGAALGSLFATLILLPVMCAILDFDGDFTAAVLGITNPLVVLAMASDSGPGEPYRTGIPLAVCLGGLGAVALTSLINEIDTALSKTSQL
jgi:ABC-type transport system involved in multi-copper enzyme maturation permease subunit